MDEPKVTFSSTVSVDTLKRLIAAMESREVRAVELITDEKSFIDVIEQVEKRPIPEVSVEESLDRE